MKKLLVAVALLLLAGCGSGSGLQFYQDFGPTFPVSNDGKAALYIVRDTADAGAAPINVTMDGQPVATLASRDYVRLNLAPRLYDLRAYGSQANSELIVTVAPGQTRFLLAQPAPRDGAQLFEMSMQQGRRLVRQGQQVGTIDTD